jgi:hypothetical protein
MKVVGIHGIAQDYSGPYSTESDWFPALQDGLKIAGEPLISGGDFAMVFYGDLFRRSETMRSLDIDIPPLDWRDVEDDWEKYLLFEWWREAAKLSEDNKAVDNPLGEDACIQGPDAADTRGFSDDIVQPALMQLTKSKFFRAFGPEKFLIFGLKQVHQYLHDESMKQKILQRVYKEVSGETRVIIGHSLGSIVAYEALCKHPEWNVHTLVTLGSPLGIANLIFDALIPKPENGIGAWPNVKQWFNIADKGDIVALNKNLASCFGPKVIDTLVHNGWKSHSAKNYLTAKETGQAIATGL